MFLPCNRKYDQAFFRRNRKYAARDDETCGDTCLQLVAIFLVALLGFFILYPLGVILVYNPVDPDVHVDSATVSQLSITTTGSGSGEITATWQLTLVITNPNQKLDLYLESLQASLFHAYTEEAKSIMLATKPLPPPFCEIKMKNRTPVSVSFQLKTIRAYLGDDVAKEILGGSARLGLKLLGWYHFKNVGFALEGSQVIRLFCDPIEFSRGVFPNNGTTISTTMATGHSTLCDSDPTTYHYYY